MGIVEDFLIGLFSQSNNKKEELNVGDWVHIIPYGCDGQIIAIYGNKYEVDVDEHDDGNGTVDVFDRKDLMKIC